MTFLCTVIINATEISDCLDCDMQLFNMTPIVIGAVDVTVLKEKSVWRCIQSAVGEYLAPSHRSDVGREGHSDGLSASTKKYYSTRLLDNELHMHAHCG